MVTQKGLGITVRCTATVVTDILVALIERGDDYRYPHGVKVLEIDKVKIAFTGKIAIYKFVGYAITWAGSNGLAYHGFPMHIIGVCVEKFGKSLFYLNGKGWPSGV